MNTSMVASIVRRYRAVIAAILVFGIILGSVSAINAQSAAKRKPVTGSATKQDPTHACRSAQNTCKMNLGACPAGSSVNFIRDGVTDRFCTCVETVKSGRVHFTCEATCECLRTNPRKTEPGRDASGECGDPAITKYKPCAGGCIPVNYTCCANGSWCPDQRQCLPEPGACAD